MSYLTVSRIIQSISLIAIMLLVLRPACNCLADSRFSSSYQCQDAGKKCVSSGVRTVDGYQVYKDCWAFAYEKTCNYPSKNDCGRYAHCYLVAVRDCLLKDSLGNCANQSKEFSCKRWEPVTRESRKVRAALEEQDGEDSVVCEGVPCIDGNCVDKSYLTNGEMMDSVSKLYVVSEGKAGDDMNFEIFKGADWHCSKKMAEYTNCCSTGNTGWGTNLGARCTKDEQTLSQNRRNNLCVYVGKKEKTTIGVTTVVKHHWCCFDSVLSKVIQVEGRKQLGLTFGTADAPSCRGLTLDELERINFHKIDLTESIEDFKAKFFGKYKSPNIADMETRIRGTIPNIRKYDGDPHNPRNNQTGWSVSVKDDSWEAQEEKRFEEERIRLIKEEETRLALENTRRAEEQRLAEIEKQQEEARLAQIRAAEDKARRKANVEHEIRRAEADEQQAVKDYNWWSYYKARLYDGFGDVTRHPDYQKMVDVLTKPTKRKERLKHALATGNY